MDWKSLLGGIAPAISSVLTVAGGPVGAVAGAALSAVSNAVLGHPNGTPDQVAQAIQAGLPPESVVKLQQADSEFKLSMEQQVTAQLGQRVQNASDINATMQTEAKADHWPTYTWRPVLGFSMALDLVLTSVTVMVCYIGVMFFGVKADVLAYLPMMIGAMSALLAIPAPILGVASWFRGKAQADPNISTDNRG